MEVKVVDGGERCKWYTGEEYWCTVPLRNEVGGVAVVNSLFESIHRKVLPTETVYLYIIYNFLI